LLLALVMLALGASFGCRSKVAASSTAEASVATAVVVGPAKKGSEAAEPIMVKWEELEIPLGPEDDFQPWMLSTAIKSLDGGQVRITGFMHEGVAQKSHIREFVLVKHVGCQFGAEGQPQHVVMVELQGKLRASLTAEAETLEGKFAVAPYTGPDGRTWALYKLAATKFEEGQR
jgi:hypothetical protein